LIAQIISGEQYDHAAAHYATSSTPSRYLFPLRPKYFAQHPILQHPQPMFPISTTDQILNPYKTAKL
jgi:hypothetical protein